jgi:chemotaxis protein MotB
LTRGDPTAYDTASGGGESGEDWLMSYADFVTVLMGFFVLLFAMSDPNPGRFEEVSKGYAEGLKPITTPFVDLRRAQTAALSPGEEGERTPTTGADPRGMATPFAADRMFSPGQAEILPEAEPFLDRTAQLLTFGFGRVTYRVTIEAHTDDSPISSDRFPSNWELSAARAAAVARYMITRGVEPGRIVAAGRADSNPLPETLDQRGQLVATPENRAKNRRILIRIDR